MGPLFTNRMAVDKAMLLEWYKQDFKKNHRLFTLGHILLIVAYVILAVSFIVSGVLLKNTVLLVCGAVVVLLAVLFLLNLLLQYRIQVWVALRRDKGRDYCRPYVLLFYPAHVVMVKNLGENDGPKRERWARSCLDEAAGLQMEFVAMVQSMEGLDVADEARLLELRDALESLQSRMEVLNAEMATMEQYGLYRYEEMTDYIKTEHLHVLYFGEQALLVDRRGFEEGTDAGFADFVRKLAEAVTATTDSNRLKKRLEPAVEKQESKTE